jgi:hypothetical protein
MLFALQSLAHHLFLITTLSIHPQPRLSERNVIDLVAKLQDLGYLGDGGTTALATADGRGYVTRARLGADLLAAVREAGGRAALVDLPAALNVDLAHVEAMADELLVAAPSSPSSSGLARAGGDLVLPTFWACLAAEVAALLADGGACPSIGDLAARFGLAADALVAGLTPHLASPAGSGSVPARIEGGRLVAPAAVARARAALRGALRGAAAPANLASLNVGGGGSQAGSLGLATLAESLVAAGEVAGRVRPGGVWVPAAHEAAAAASLASAWAADGFIEYGRVTGGGGGADRRGALARLEATFPGGVALQGAFVGPPILAAVEAAAAAAGAGTAGGWVDVHTVVPPALTRGDTAALVQRAVAGKAGGAHGGGGRAAAQATVLAGTCVLSAGLLADLAAKVEALARASAMEAAALPGWKKASASAVPVAPRPADGGSGGEEEEDWGRGRSSGKGGRKGGKGRPRPAAADRPKPSLSSSAGPPALSLRSLTTRCGAWVPGSAAAGAHEEEEDGEGGCCLGGGTLASALAAHLRPAALSAYDQAVQDTASLGASSRRRAREAAVKAAAEAGDRVQLYGRGCDLLLSLVATPAAPAEGASLATTLHRHLARGPGAEAVDGWLGALLLDAGGEAAPPSLTPAARAAAVTPGAELIPGDALKAAGAAVRLLAASSPPPPAALVAALDALATAAGGRLVLLDRKAERTLLAAVRAGLGEAVASATDPASALPPAIALAFAAAHGRALSVPGRALGAVIAALEEEEADGAATAPPLPSLLREFHALIVAQLKGEAGGEARLAELLPAVQARMRQM